MTTDIGALSRVYTPERLEIEYSPAKWHADRAETLHRHHLLGERAVAACRPSLDIRYGAGLLQTLDLFPSAERRGPCWVILHGGFWRTSDKAAMHFVAGTLSQQGASCIVPNFDLCPAISIAQMVSQVGDALAWTAAHAAEFSDPDRGILLFGHATGAHLAAMLLTQASPCARASWLAHIRGSLLISGLYDLRRIPELEVNRFLQLDEAMAARMSPLLSQIAVKTPLVVASAQDETSEFQAQSANFADMARRQGIATELISIPSVGHFTLLDEVPSGTGPCIAAAARLSTGLPNI